MLDAVDLKPKNTRFIGVSVEKLLQSLSINQKDFKQYISLITQDSRRVVPGAIFFALRGSDEVKVRNLEQAIKKRAKLVVHSFEGFGEGLYVKDVHSLFSETLKLYFKESTSKLKVYGVTGTNGKTTYSYMLKGLLESYGVPTGIFGTVENAFRENKLETGLTSPIAEDFYSFSHENYNKNGMRALVCEVSSHALDQKRMGLEFLDGAAFTSFSQDHLDYHKTMDGYLKAKLKIYSEALKQGAYFCASPKLKDPLSSTKVDILNHGDYKISFFKKDYGQEVEFTKISKNKSLKGFLPMLGGYNVENFGLALMTLCAHFGDEFFPDERVFNNFTTPPGRMEPVFYKDKPFAYVDYSHTPDSLEKALKTLKETNEKVFVVFGCGGNRDQEKRALMGKVSSDYADYCFVTSDNPRDEHPNSIINDIISGVTVTNYLVLEDRRAAIQEALTKANSEKAVVLIAGKGHETTQEINGEKKYFSDIEEIKRWVADNGS